MIIVPPINLVMVKFVISLPNKIIKIQLYPSQLSHVVSISPRTDLNYPTRYRVPYTVGERQYCLFSLLILIPIFILGFISRIWILLFVGRLVKLMLQ